MTRAVLLSHHPPGMTPVHPHPQKNRASTAVLRCVASFGCIGCIQKLCRTHARCPSCLREIHVDHLSFPTRCAYESIYVRRINFPSFSSKGRPRGSPPAPYTTAGSFIERLHIRRRLVGACRREQESNPGTHHLDPVSLSSEDEQTRVQPITCFGRPQNDVWEQHEYFSNNRHKWMGHARSWLIHVAPPGSKRDFFLKNCH